MAGTEKNLRVGQSMSELHDDIRDLTSLIEGKFTASSGVSSDLIQLRALLQLQVFRAQNLRGENDL